MRATIWFNAEIPAQDTNRLLAEAVRLSKLAFGRRIADDLQAGIKEGKYTVKSETDGMFISVQQPDDIFFGIKARPALMGSMLYVEYIHP